MQTRHEYFKGYPPALKIGEGNPEAIKYGKLWETTEYRKHSPGEYFVQYFLGQAKPKPGASVIDFGCGSGRAGLKLKETGLSVTMLDFTKNCLDGKVRESLDRDLTFLKHDLTKKIPVIAEYGYCTDVMEHIPPDDVNIVIDNILRAAKHNFFAICTITDGYGKLIGEKLHMTVEPYEWWQEKFSGFQCVVHWSEKIGSYAFFLVSAWEESQILVEHGKLNTKEELILQNVEHNCQQGYNLCTPHPTNEDEVMIVGAAPSISAYEDEIRQKRENGIKLITLNGSYNWCLERGIKPSGTVIVDAREFNKRFVDPPVDNCKYFLSSQCHPSVFEGIPKEQIWLWHSMSDVTFDTIRKYYPAPFSIPGGSTVFLRSVVLMRQLGFHKFHVFGCDSCLQDGKHHAFSQPENDGQVVIPILAAGKTFYCHPWMASQAREFQTLIQRLGETFDMIVYGDGLLAHIIKTGANLAPQEG